MAAVTRAGPVIGVAPTEVAVSIVETPELRNAAAGACTELRAASLWTPRGRFFELFVPRLQCLGELLHAAPVGFLAKQRDTICCEPAIATLAKALAEREILLVASKLRVEQGIGDLALPSLPPTLQLNQFPLVFFSKCFKTILWSPCQRGSLAKV